MKKLFTTLAFTAAVTFGAFAQKAHFGSHCGTSYSDTTAITPNAPTGNPGLSPTSDSLTPGVNGTYLSDTIHFENYVSFENGLATVTYLKIDSINNLPNGLCWETNKPDNKFAGGETGVILVQGTPYDSAGQYKLVIIIDVNTSLTGALTNQNAEQLTGATGGTPLRYYVRLNCQGGAVVPIDTVEEDSLHTVFVPYASQTNCTIYHDGLNEISNVISGVSVVPNPFTSSANIEFNSSVEGTYTVKMTNLLGATVSSKEVNVTRGANNIAQDRNGLSSGIYLLSISNGQSAITKKVIID